VVAGAGFEPAVVSPLRRSASSLSLSPLLTEGDTPEHYNIFRWRIFVKSGRQVLDPAMEAAGITRVSRGHGFHIFRHSAASILYD